MSATNEQLNNWGYRTLKAMNFSDLERSKENEAIAKEAKAYGVSPNVVLQHINNNYKALMREVKGLGTLSSFTTAWKAQNPDTPLNGPEFLAALGEEAKQYKNFDYTR